jgi:hypothetical protein
MLATLGWSVAIIAFIGSASCIALQTYFVMRGRVDAETKADSQNKFMVALAAFFGFFVLAIVGVILLQVSGAYGHAR